MDSIHLYSNNYQVKFVIFKLTTIKLQRWWRKILYIKYSIKLQRWWRKFNTKVTCPVCIEEIPSYKMTLSYNCTHALCTTCFNNWNFRSNTCPTCRAVSIYTNANNPVSHVQYNINDRYLINSENVADNINDLNYDQLLNDLRNILNNNRMNYNIYEVITDSINNLILQSDSSQRRNSNYNYNNINDLDNNINDLNYDQLISDLRNILNNNQMNNSSYEIIRDSINNLILQSNSSLRRNSNYNYNYNNHTNSITEPNQPYGYNINTNILIID